MLEDMAVYCKLPLFHSDFLNIFLLIKVLTKNHFCSSFLTALLKLFGISDGSNPFLKGWYEQSLMLTEH